MNEEEKESIKNLEKYIEEDFAYREPIKNYSDFDKFCYNHCKNIETVLNLIEKLRERLKLMDDYNYWVQLATNRGLELEKLQKENQDITQQRDYYKARYNEFNEAFIENGRKLTK